VPASPSLLESLADAVGAHAVVTDTAALAASSHDTWPLSTKRALTGEHPNQADVIVKVSSTEEISAVLAAATVESVPVTVRALGSSVTGQPLPVRGGIVLDVSGMPASYSVDETNMTVTASASYNGGQLEDALAAKGWTMAMSPQSLYRSSVGGWIATLATGQFSSLYGGIEDLTIGYTVILATGEMIELKASPRAAMGPDLRQFFIGSEGTLGVITSVTFKIFPVAEAQLLQTFAMPTVRDGLAFMREQVSVGLRPFLIRFYDVDEARHAMVDPTIDTPILFLGSRGVPSMVETELAILSELAEKHGGEALGPAGAEAWMGRRFDFSSVEKLLAEPGGFAETIEVAHNWSQINELHTAMKEALAPMATEVLAHFSHVYSQGTSMYVILLGKAESDEAAVARLETIWKTAMEVCLSLSAELSHHHGGGLARSPYTKRSLGDAHLILRKVKAALDPAGILNPGKLGL
jgi:alkyldihydroxyacetonephosphate synthase